MSTKPGGADGGDKLGERIAGLQGIVGCLMSTILAIIVTGAWLWINASLPSANAPLPPPSTATRPPVSQPTRTSTPIIR